MSTKHRINHRVKNQVWVRPEIGYDAWAKINAFARNNGLDFPSAIDYAAGLLPDKMPADVRQ